MNGPVESGTRANQKLRTRKDLLEAASRLMREGRSPTFEEIAEAAMVSRATAYRYFPGIEALLREAALDVEVPTPEALFGEEPSTDPLVRLAKLDEALSAMMAANEAPLRALLAQSLQQGEAGAPVRQNRRSPLIAAALAPVRRRLRDPDTLEKALVVLLGIEARVVFSDVLQLTEPDAARIRRWMIRTLVEAALRD